MYIVHTELFVLNDNGNGSDPPAQRLGGGGKYFFIVKSS